MSPRWRGPRLSFAHGQPPSSKTESTDFTATMLHHRGGRLLVAVISLAIIGVGGFPIVKISTHAGRLLGSTAGDRQPWPARQRNDTQRTFSGTPCGSPARSGPRPKDDAQHACDAASDPLSAHHGGSNPDIAVRRAVPDPISAWTPRRAGSGARYPCRLVFIYPKGGPCLRASRTS